MSYEDFMKMLENQPSLLPRPNCMCLRAWPHRRIPAASQSTHNTLAAAMKMINAQFTIDMNFYQTYYSNIKRALYNLLTKSVGLLYQASTTPGLSGWDPSMSIHDILAQLNSTYGYGKPDAQTTEANEAMFCMLIQPKQTPESVFLCLKECQEVAIPLPTSHTLTSN